VQCEDGALDGGRRAVFGPERRDQLVYLFGEGRDLLRYPTVAAPLQWPPGPDPGLLDQSPGLAFRVVEHHGLSPAGNGCADGTGVGHLAAVRFGRPEASGDEQPAAAFEPEGGPRPNGEDFHVGFGRGAPAGVAADEDGGFGPFPRQVLRRLPGYRERGVRGAVRRHFRGASAAIQG
jgi:hypothetical protein